MTGAHGSKRVGILLVNTGTPHAPKPRAVRRYLRKFLMDKRIAPMNRAVWWFILHFCILPKRSKASAAKYREIWTDEGAPFLLTHEKLVRGLQDHLDKREIDARVALGMSYGEPSIVRGVRELQKLGCERLVVLPLYPQSAFCTTEAVKDGVKRAVRKTHWRGGVTIVDDYHDNPRYVRAIAASVENAGFDVQGNDRLLFSYHSIPLKDIEAGDTYELQTGATSVMVASELGLERNRWTIAYQCRFDKGREWLEPFTQNALTRWAGAGEGRVFVVCPNFAVDCLETTYDICKHMKGVYHDAARKAHVGSVPYSFTYVPCLNAAKVHLRVIVDVLAPYIMEE